MNGHTKTNGLHSSRRGLLKALLVGAALPLGAGLLAACGQPAATPTAPAASPPTAAPQPTTPPAAAPTVAAAKPTAQPTVAAIQPAATTQAAPAKSGGKITALMATDKPWLPDTAKKFQQATGIVADLTLVDYNDIETKFVASAAANSAGYDVVETVSVAWAQAGYLADLTDLIKDKADLVNPNLYTYQGKIYGMPWFIDALFFFYNKEYLSKAGIDAPPKTWDDFVTTAQAVQSKAGVKYPITFQWKQIEGEFDLFETFLFGFGGKVFNADQTAPAFNDDHGVAALQFEADLYQKYKLVDPNSFASRPLEVTKNLAAGNTAFGILWGGLSGLLTDPKSSKEVGKIDVSLIPVKGNNPSTTTDGSETVSMVAKSANKDAAWSWIDFLTGKETATNVLLNYQTLPPWKSLYNDSTLTAKVPWMKGYGEQLKNDFRFPAKTWQEEFSNALQVATISVLSGQKPAKAALDDAAAKVTEIMKKG